MKWTHSMVGRRRGARGSSLIEILVSLLILMVALLGLTGLMVQSQNSQLESYQRVQALALAQDMVSRINANSAVASCYVLASYLGTNSPLVSGTAATTNKANVPQCTAGTANQQARANQDLADWHDLILGSAEVVGTNKVGAVLGARGCVSLIAGTTNEYQVSVAWQGGGATYAPPAGITCGKDLYGTDTQRRAVSLPLHITNLS